MRVPSNCTVGRASERFCAVAVGAPVSLAEQGFREADVERCAGIVLETDNGLNPKPVTLEAVRGILRAALRAERPA